MYNLGCPSQPTGHISSHRQSISEHLSTHSAIKARPILVPTANSLISINGYAENNTNIHFSPIILVTRPGISHYPNDNQHVHVSNHFYNLEGNEHGQQPSSNRGPSSNKELSSHSYSNELSLSYTILMFGSFISPSIQTSNPTAPLWKNSHAMLTRAINGKSKPKIFVSHIKSEPTSAKQALTKPEWAQAMQTKFKPLQANGTWTLTTLL